MLRYGKDKGTGIGEWQENTAVLGAGPAGATGSTGPGALITATNASPGVSLNGSARRPDASHDVLVTACVKIDTTVSISGGQGGTVRLLSDSANPPTTEVARTASSSTGTLTVGLNLVTSNVLELHYRVKAGDFYKLTTANDTGTPTFTLISVVEQTLG